MEMITDLINRQVHIECENHFQKWQNSILNSYFGDLPEPINDRLKEFTLQQKHLFFRDFKQKIQKYVIKKLTETSSLANEINTEELLIKNKSFDKAKERLFLETYFLANQNGALAARKLGIPKSTFHDWLRLNRHLIESELAQRAFNLSTGIHQ